MQCLYVGRIACHRHGGNCHVWRRHVAQRCVDVYRAHIGSCDQNALNCIETYVADHAQSSMTNTPAALIFTVRMLPALVVTSAAGLSSR